MDMFDAATSGRVRGFSLIQITVVLAAIAILSGLGVVAVGRAIQASHTAKLSADAKALNAAVLAFRGSGGDLSDITDPKDVISHLKSALSDREAARHPGFSGSFCDSRLDCRMQTVIEAASDEPRCYWSPEVNRFVVATSGEHGGVAEFILDESGGIEVSENVKRETAFRFGKGDWVWDYNDAVEQDKADDSISDRSAVPREKKKMRSSMDEYPVLLTDSITVLGDRPRVINVLDNDHDPDGGALVCLSVSEEKGGVCTLSPDGQCTFVPEPSFTGKIVFTYHAVDDEGDEGSSEIIVQVNSSQDGPLLVPDPFECLTQEEKRGNVLDNDMGDGLKCVGFVCEPALGDIQIEPNGDYLFKTESNFIGALKCTYDVEDQYGNTASCSFSIICNGSGERCNAIEDKKTINLTARATRFSLFPKEKQECIIDVLSNDKNPSGGKLNIIQVAKLTEKYPFDYQVTTRGEIEIVPKFPKTLPGEPNPLPTGKWQEFFGSDKWPASSKGSIDIGKRLRHLRDRLPTLGPEKIFYMLEDSNGHVCQANVTINFATTVNYSPLALDLDGDDAIGRVDREVIFDIDGDGRMDRLSQWYDSTDGILIRQPERGEAVSGIHLFGDQGRLYDDGFDKLSQLDANADGQVDLSEADGLVIWRDLNTDAQLDDGELLSLRSAGVVSLGTAHRDYIGAAVGDDGSSIHLEDVWFPVVIESE